MISVWIILIMASFWGNSFSRVLEGWGNSKGLELHGFLLSFCKTSLSESYFQWNACFFVTAEFYLNCILRKSWDSECCCKNGIEEPRIHVRSQRVGYLCQRGWTRTTENREIWWSISQDTGQMWQKYSVSSGKLHVYCVASRRGKVGWGFWEWGGGGCCCGACQFFSLVLQVWSVSLSMLYTLRSCHWSKCLSLYFPTTPETRVRARLCYYPSSSFDLNLHNDGSNYVCLVYHHPCLLGYSNVQ